MEKVDVIQVYISTAAIFGIGVLWFNITQKVFYSVCDLIKAPFIENDSPMEPERYPAEEPG